jgi:hypothetical protein
MPRDTWALSLILGQRIHPRAPGRPAAGPNYNWALGCREHRTAASVKPADRERIQACMDQYARALVNKVADAFFGHLAGSGSKIQ